MGNKGASIIAKSIDGAENSEGEFMPALVSMPHEHERRHDG